MNNEQLDKILLYLDKVGEKIGATSKEIWPWLVKQQYIDAFTTLFFLVLFLLMFGFSCNKFLKLKWSHGEPDNWMVVIFFGISCIALLFSFLIFLSQFMDLLQKIK